MTKAAEKRAEAERATETLREILGSDPGAAPIIWSLTDHGSGLTDYVRLFVITTADGEPWVREITYYAARAAGIRQTQRGLAFGGGNYSKALEAADHVWRVVYGRALDQSRWQRL